MSIKTVKLTAIKAFIERGKELGWDAQTIVEELEEYSEGYRGNIRGAKQILFDGEETIQGDPIINR